MAFDPAQVLTNGLSTELIATFVDHFPEADRNQADFLRDAVSLAMSHLTLTSASYHDADHTIMVVMAGQDILRGKALEGSLKASDWLHSITAMLFHDIGYSRSACKSDTDTALVSNLDGGRFFPEAGTSDAILAPYHVDRAMIFVREQFGDSPIVDADRLAAAIDYTRFPVPKSTRYASLTSEPGLVRAADLIGQLADPLYPQKLTNLYYEMLETGTADALGYRSTLDMINAFPEFFRTSVEPFLGPALDLLERTPEGQNWVLRLRRLLAQIEAGNLKFGPFKS